LASFSRLAKESTMSGRPKLPPEWGLVNGAPFKDPCANCHQLTALRARNEKLETLHADAAARAVPIIRRNEKLEKVAKVAKALAREPINWAERWEALDAALAELEGGGG
jgi:hypothetical protein